MQPMQLLYLLYAFHAVVRMWRGLDAAAIRRVQTS